MIGEASGVWVDRELAEDQRDINASLDFIEDTWVERAELGDWERVD